MLLPQQQARSDCVCLLANMTLYSRWPPWSCYALLAGKFAAQGPEAAPGGRALDSSSPAVTINLDERQQGETLSQLEVCNCSKGCSATNLWEKIYM